MEKADFMHRVLPIIATGQRGTHQTNILDNTHEESHTAKGEKGQAGVPETPAGAVKQKTGEIAQVTNLEASR